MRAVGITVTLLLLALPLVGGARAAADVGFKGAGGRLSYVDADVGHTLGFGAHLELGEPARDWALQAVLSYWSTTTQDTDLTTDLLTVEADIRYLFHGENPSFLPYAGGGLGLHFGGRDTAPDEHVSETRVGLTFVAGTYYTVDPNVDLLGEFRYVFADHYDHWSLSVGVTFRFDQ